jgi:hypothetical protein
MASHKHKCNFDGKKIQDDEPFVMVHHGDACVPVKLDNLGSFASRWQAERDLRKKAEDAVRAGLDPDEMNASDYARALTKGTDRKVAEIRQALTDSAEAKAGGKQA